MPKLKDLAKDIITSYEIRIQLIQEVVENVEKLKKILSRSQTLRKNGFNKIMKEVLAIQNEHEKYLGKTLSNFGQKQREQMETAERLQKFLKNSEGVRLAVSKTLNNINKNQIGKKTKNMREQIGTELAQMKIDMHRYYDQKEV